jgi:hypothetical protein
VVREQLTYARGRPPKSGARRVAQTRYVLEGRIVEREGAVERARQAAGCFVLLTNVPAEGEMAHAPGEVLAAYKEQHGIERNFGFLEGSPHRQRHLPQAARPHPRCWASSSWPPCSPGT